MADPTMLVRAKADFGFERPGYVLRQEPWLGVGKIQASAAMLANATGLSAPDANTQRETGGISCAWLAPGEWLLTGADADVSAMLDRARAGGGDMLLATDLSHGRVSFVLSGCGARDVLAALCPLDLWDGAFAVDAVARTLLGDTVMFLARLSDADGQPRFRIVVDQTMARYAAHMLAGPPLSRSPVRDQ